MWVGRLWVPDAPAFDSSEEECGVVIGIRRKGWLYGREFLRVRNDADNPAEHFRMHLPLSILSDVVATFHTHPATEAFLAPSEHDRAVSTRIGLYGLVIAPDGRLRTYLGHYTSPVAHNSKRRRIR